MKPDSMVELQNRWYNALTAQLGLDPDMFQINLPAAPISRLDTEVWDYRDAIPPASLTFNRAFHKFPRFSGQYAAVVHQTGGNSDALEAVIGKEAYAQWSEFLRIQAAPPPLSQLPTLFLHWAMIHFPVAATAGASALARAILEAAAMPGPPREYRGSYRELREELCASTGAAVSFEAGAVTANTRGAWAAAHAGVDGIWAGAFPDSPSSRKFAQSEVAVEVRFQRYAISPSHPGAWYREAALRAAFENPGSPPWPEAMPGTAPVWSSFFGGDGSMPRAIESLVMADGIDVSVTSNADFTPRERARLESNAAKGLWPLHAATSGTVANEVERLDAGSVRLRIAIKPNNPVAIGNNVLSMARYLARTSDRAERGRASTPPW